MTVLCRDCSAFFEHSAATTTPDRCRRCGSPRLVAHPELGRLAIAHLDCDAFYASVETRDAPELLGKPVIVGGGQRGVVLAASYAVRRHGVRSAMPMYRALDLCPDAVVLRPRFERYREASRQVRAILQTVTPLIEPLSLDEAFLDLNGTRTAPALHLAEIARRIEREVGITASIGLSFNKFLAKIASDLDKPRGFAVIGRGDAAAFLAAKPVGILWGVGPAMQRRLHADGFFTVADLQRRSETELVHRYAAIGRRLARFARGDDDRPIVADAATISISAETTFEQDLVHPTLLRQALEPLCARVAERLDANHLGACSIVLKLKRTDFRILTRSRSLPEPTMRSDRIFAVAARLLAEVADGSAFRLIGVGAAGLCDAALADPPDLFDPDAERGARAAETDDTESAVARAAAKSRFRGQLGG